MESESADGAGFIAACAFSEGCALCAAVVSPDRSDFTDERFYSARFRERAAALPRVTRESPSGPSLVFVEVSVCCVQVSSALRVTRTTTRDKRESLTGQ